MTEATLALLPFNDLIDLLTITTNKLMEVIMNYEENEIVIRIKEEIELIQRVIIEKRANNSLN